MNLTLLGTSHGVPSDIRYGSCYMLEVGENIYIFDGGAPVIDLLLREGKDLSKVKAFFCSHFHGDHIMGAISMFSLFNWYFKDADMDIYMPDAKSEKALVDFVAFTDAQPFPSERIRTNVYSDGVIFDDGVIKVTATRTQHNCGPDKKAYAFLIEAEGKSILYTGDMSGTPDTNDFPKVAYDRFIDIILCECAHFPVERMAKCMDKVNTDLFIVTHMFPMTKIDEIEAIKEKYNYEVIIAEDGDEIEM